MIFKRKFDRFIELQKSRRGDRERAYDNNEIENVIEKGDTLAMILAALLVIIPVALVVLVVAALIGYFFIVRGG
ncbi:MAG: hypothetical protein ACOYH4_03125 [Saccharofermentanales bacterium]|jgi:hypothetical protein